MFEATEYRFQTGHSRFSRLLKLLIAASFASCQVSAQAVAQESEVTDPSPYFEPWETKILVVLHPSLAPPAHKSRPYTHLIKGAGQGPFYGSTADLVIVASQCIHGRTVWLRDFQHGGPEVVFTSGEAFPEASGEVSDLEVVTCIRDAYAGYFSARLLDTRTGTSTAAPFASLYPSGNPDAQTH